jgi:hypothetical protein
VLDGVVPGIEEKPLKEYKKYFTSAVFTTVGKAPAFSAEDAI